MSNSPTITTIVWAVLCGLLVALTLGLLVSDGLWDSADQLQCPTQPTQAPIQSPTAPTEQPTEPPEQPTEPSEPPTEPEQRPVLPPEPAPQEPKVEVTFGEPAADPWAAYPDGIRIEKRMKTHFVANVMYVKDPSAVYLATSTNHFSLSTPGTRIVNQLKAEGALAGINAGAFNDDGTANVYVGSVPIGMVVSEGKILYDDGRSYLGFVGMTEDHRLYVSNTINAATIKELGIRDGCCFGPVLIKDGQVNEKVYSIVDNRNSRTAIGQKADGTIIFLCIDGRQVGSMGALPGEVLDMMLELGAVNACTLDGGASTVMAYRDTYGLYGKSGEAIICSSYSLFQAAPRRMPTFFMVRPSKTEE